MKPIHAVLAALTSLTLAACSVTVPVIGLRGDGADLYKGTATGYGNGSGEIRVKSLSSGIECFGGFTFTRDLGGTGSSGIADVMCKDGRRASVLFVNESRSRGMGTGYDSSGKPIVFTYGMTEQETVDVLHNLLSKDNTKKKNHDNTKEPKREDI